MKKLVLIASVLMAVLLCTATMMVLPIAAEGSAGAISIEPGADTWSFDAETGTLTISYVGPMPDFATTAPWADYHSEIKAVVIEEGVTSIGNKAFASCDELTTVHIPQSVTKIGDYAFRFCEKLETVTFAAGSRLESIGEYAFEECASLKSIGLTADMPLTYIGTYAFSYCASLESIVIPRTVTAIADYTFSYCTSLESVEFGLQSQIKSIGAHAFRNCKELATIAIPEGVTTLGSSAFRGCSALTAVTIPASVVNIGDTLLDSCSALTSVYYHGSREAFAAISLGAFNETLAATLKYEGDEHTHVYGAWAACKTDNCHKMMCACGDVKESQAHNWNAGEVTVAPTHMTVGEKTYTCLDCGAQYTAEIAKIASHTYGPFEKHDADKHKATCECGDVIYEEHTWNEGVEVLAPTHNTEGQRHHVCNDCGETKETEIAKTTEHTGGKWIPYNETHHQNFCSCGLMLNEAEHNWNDGEVTLAPTHTTFGVKTYTCVDCGDTKTEQVSMLEAHLYGFAQRVLAGETDSEGNPVDAGKYHKHVCACGDIKYDQEHTWNKGEITVGPTHLKAGVMTYTCKECGQTKQSEIAKLAEHTYVYYQYVDADSHKILCECGESISEAHDWSAWKSLNNNQHKRTCQCTIETEAHHWDAGVETKAPTHTEFGEMTHTCLDCYKTKVELIAKTTEHTVGRWTPYNDTHHQKICACGDVLEEGEHHWNDGEVTIAPTHTTFGEKTYTCLDCGAHKTESVEKLPDHVFESWTPYNADQHQKCCACGETVAEAYAAHNWNSGVTTVPATHLTEGKMKQTCLDCGATQTVSIAKTSAHTYDGWVKYNEDHHQAICACGQTDTKYAEHNWNDGEVLSAATHTSVGQKKLTCQDCGQEKTVDIPMLSEHTYGEWTFVEGQDGHQRACACGDVQTEEHTWGEGVVSKEPTKKKTGIREYCCEICGATMMEDIEKLPGLQAWVIIVIVAAVLVIAAVVLIIVLRRRKIAALSSVLASGVKPSSAMFALSSSAGLAMLKKKLRRNRP